MKIKLAKYISKFLVDNGINTMFMVTGGGAMHLNDAFGHQEGLKCYYNHHEQACSTGAEGYYRVNSKMASTCVTTGPGSTNAITGVMAAYLDSIPMFVVSGEVKDSNTVAYTGLNLRQYGDQEYDITRMAQYCTKYTYMVRDPKTIKYHLEKALYLAKSGRPGPVWLAIPLNVQSSIIETDELISYDYHEDEYKSIIKNSDLDLIVEKLKNAKRPVIYAGSAIRLSGGLSIFNKLIKKLNVPVVCAFNAIDTVDKDNSLYAGRAGINGDRAGNFAVQNSDFILSLGCRLNFRQVGFNYESWAREAYVVMVDADEAELNKPSLHVDLKIKSEIKTFMTKLNNFIDSNVSNQTAWIEQCQEWVKKYPVVLDSYKNPNREMINAYYFTESLTKVFKKNTVYVVGNGTAIVTSSQCAIVNPGMKYICNSGSAQMGYDLPAAIGACIANNCKDIVCSTGDGSIQMNIQELQTIVTNKLPIKLFVINNDGYHSIRQTQTNYFEAKYVGIGPDSKDLSFPELKKIAKAYGIKYFALTSNSTLEMDLKKIINKKGPFICEVFVDKVQTFEPKASSKKLEDGTMVSAPLEDLYPFLPRDEFKNNMYVPFVGENK